MWTDRDPCPCYSAVAGRIPVESRDEYDFLTLNEKCLYKTPRVSKTIHSMCKYLYFVL